MGGGSGYGGTSRPDLSNTSFLIDALKSTGNDENRKPAARLTSARHRAPSESGPRLERVFLQDALNPEQTVTCVHSLFPHNGYSPCWYVKPRINQPIPL